MAWLALATQAQAQIPADLYNYSRTSSFTYQTNGLLQSETVEPDNTALCVTTSYVYDAAGNKSGATTANCLGAAGRALFTSRSSATSYGAVAAQPIVVAGSAVNVAIPAGLFATRISNALNQSETRQYDPRFGAVISLTGPNALTTTIQIDDFGRKAKELRADGTSSLTYHCMLTGKGLDTSANSVGCGSTAALSGQADEIPGDAISYVQAESRDTANAKMGPAARIYSDRAGRKLREISEAFDGAGQPATRRYVVKDTLYNNQGVAELSTQPYFLGADSSTVAGSADVGLTLTRYDALGRPTRIDVSDPAGNVPGVDFGGRGVRTSARTTVTYSGLTTTTVNPKGQGRTEEKNADGVVVRITDSYGGQVAHQHDAFGNLVQTRDALQNRIKISYDTRGRKVSMTDPDTGLWQYDYNALGELVWQQSPNQRAAGTATSMAYDRLGRMTSRVEPEYTSTWSFDTYIGGAACNKGIGKLCESTTTHGVNKRAVYDNLGRPESSRTTIASGPSFATAVSYQASTGRIDTQTWPTGLKVSYGYTALGFVSRLETASAATLNPLPAAPCGVPGASGGLLWTACSVNAWGQAETHSLGNGITSHAAFDPATGRLTRASAGAGSASNVLDHRYTWDSLNRLSVRIDKNGDGSGSGSGSAIEVSETFEYDNLNRLAQYAVSAPQIPNLRRNVTLIYNAIGNILHKSDVGNYDYPPYGSAAGVSSPRPHAVSQVVGTSAGTINYSYDANGNMVGASGGKYRSVSYTSFNLPDSNTGVGGPGGSPRYTWQYDENHQRIRETRASAQGSRTTWTQHPDNQGGLSFESETAPNGAVSNRHYLSAGGQTVVLVSTGALPTLAPGVNTPPVIASIVLAKVEYWHKDHLGSLAATTDHAGAVTARYAYDPFGKRRYTNGRYDDFGALVIDWTTDTNAGTDRGFTGHEHLDDIGIVHMNGRLYDPLIGRFTQSDPIGLAGGINTYAYVGGNPISNVDPDGLASITVGVFPGFGGQVTVGRNPNGSGFMSLQFGYGIGGGFSFDAAGKQPGYRDCQCGSWTFGYGLYGEAGVHAGLAKLALNANVGNNTNSCSSQDYRGITPKATFKDSIGMKASVSAGGQLTIGGGGSAVGGCTC